MNYEVQVSISISCIWKCVWVFVDTCEDRLSCVGSVAYLIVSSEIEVMFGKPVILYWSNLRVPSKQQGYFIVQSSLPIISSFTAIALDAVAPV